MQRVTLIGVSCPVDTVKNDLRAVTAGKLASKIEKVSRRMDGNQSHLTAACLWMSGLWASDQLHRCAAQEKTTELLLSRRITASPFLNGLLKEKQMRFLHNGPQSFVWETESTSVFSVYEQTHAVMENRFCSPGFCCLPSSTLSMIQCKIPG